MPQLSDDAGSGDRERREAMEQAVAAGFTDMSRAMETAFVGYAQLLRRSMAMHETAATTASGKREGTNG